MTVAIIVGVRPQYIKAAALVWELQQILSREPLNKILIIDTHQHFSDAMNRRIISEVSLDVDKVLPRVPYGGPALRNATHLQNLIGSLEDLEARRVLVFGDADPTLLGALAGRWLGLPVAHLEAGERRHPSEIEDVNSRAVDAIANFKLCVTGRALDNLRGEGVDEHGHLSGDHSYRWLAAKATTVQPAEAFQGRILVTIHRPYNVARLATIASSAQSVGEVSWISHPRYEASQRELLAGMPNISVHDPLSFLEMLAALKACRAVVSDSGGVIREACQMNRFAIALRQNAVWPEITMSKLGAYFPPTDEGIRAAFDAAATAADPPNAESPLSRPHDLDTAMKRLVEWMDL